MRSLPSIILLLFVAAVPAYAAPHISDFIYDDCPKAEALLGSLSEEQKIEAARVCISVLELEAPPIADPKAFAPQLAGNTAPRSTDLGDLLRATDPERDDRGKRCALGLLRALGNASSLALPVLTKQLTSLKVTDDFLNELLTTTQVALLASDAKQRVELLPLVAKHFSTLPVTLLPGLAAEANQLIDLIVRTNDPTPIDPRRLWWLSAPSKAIENQISSFFGSTEFCSTAFNLADAIVCPGKSFLTAIIAASTSNAPCRMQALRALRHLSETVSWPTSYCSGQSDLLSAADLWREMISLALRFHDEADLVPFLAITEAIVPLAAGRSFATLEKLAGTALNTPCPGCLGTHPGVELTSAVGKPAAPLIFKLLGGKSEEAKQNARAAISSLAQTDLKTVSPCLTFISNPDETIRYACFQALSPFNKEIRKDLIKLVKRKTLGITRDYAALLLLGTDVSEPSALSILKEQVSQWQCSHIDALAQFTLPQEIVSLAHLRLRSCLASPAHQWGSLISFLAHQLPLAQGAQVLVEEALPRAREHKPSLVRILKLLPAERSLTELALLHEQLAQRQPLACDAASLIWRLLDSSELRRNFLKEYTAVLGTCADGAKLPGAESELLAMLEKAAPIEQPSYIKLLGTLGSESVDVTATLENYSMKGDSAPQFEAANALLRRNAVSHVAPTQLLSLLKSSRAHALLDNHLNIETIGQIRQRLGLQEPIDIFARTTLEALERSATPNKLK